ncbi:MAG: YceI family protein [Myxococcales bacterium]|nr:YceI family protein [Myxococcales bacterium]
MKYLLSLVAAAALSFGGAAFAADWKIDGAHAAAVFQVNHLGVSTTHGRFNRIEGTITTGDAFKVSVDIDAESIDTANEKRDQHLRGPDFFDTKQFPKLTFKSTAATKASDTTWDVTGDLTIHGVTKSITIKVTKVGEGKDPWGGTRIGFDTEFVIKRADFGMNFMPGGIGEDIKIAVSLEGIQQN